MLPLPEAIIMWLSCVRILTPNFFVFVLLCIMASRRNSPVGNGADFHRSVDFQLWAADRTRRFQATH